MTARVVTVLVLAFAMNVWAQAPLVPPDTLIRLQRTHCFGTCPSYTVTIDATGLVTFDGEEYVRVVGRATSRIDRAALARLLATARRIGFFDLRDAYERDVTDLPTTFVTVTVDGRTKRIKDYDQAPPALREFEREIDAVAGTTRWIFIDHATLDGLARSGWSAATDEKIKVLIEAVRRDETTIAQRLIELGAPVSASPPLATRWTPLLYQVRSGAMVDLLVRAGADPNERSDDGRTPLFLAALFKDPGVVDALVKAGARLEEIRDGHTALYDAACSGRAEVVSILLAAGANPRGSTAAPAVDCARRSYATLEEALRGRPGDESARLRRQAADLTRVIALLESAQQRR